MVGELVVEGDEVHVPIGTGQKAIERDVSERDDVAHVRFLLFTRATNTSASDRLTREKNFA
jgi:hypothetical protein